MFVKRLLFFLFFSFFSALMTAQKQKELEEMSYAAISDSFFNNENNLDKQLKYASLYLKKANFEKKEIEIAVGYDLFSTAYFKYDLAKSSFYIDLCIKNAMKKPDAFYPMNAYWSKAVILTRQNKYNEAINYYVKAEELAKNSNSDFYFAIRLNIGIIKSEYLGEVDEALKIYKECFNFYNNDKVRDYYSNFNIRTIFSLADAFKTKQNTDSATFYNRLGYVNSKRYKNDYYLALFILNEGANQTLKKNYNIAIDSIDIALPKLKKMSDIGNNILASYYYYGKAYQGLNNSYKAVENYKRVDSIYQKSKKITPEFMDGYRFLIDYYKKTDDKEKQLYYINTLMEIDSSFHKNYKILTQKIHKDYDIPHLMREKESIIDSLKGDQKFNYYIIGVLILVVLVTVVFGIKQVQQKKKFKQLFDNLIATTPEAVEPLVVLELNTEESKHTLDISADIVIDIKTKLKLFEEEKRYKNASISIQTLAQDFNTNAKYLSGIINYTFEKSFTHYINDLRIDQIVQDLKNNKNLRKYTIIGIAEEAGFNTGESFSKAFLKRTGIKPSYFIKELNKL